VCFLKHYLELLAWQLFMAIYYILYTIYYIHAFQIITVLLKLVKKLNMKF
jgi:hypothetical protein